MLNEDGKNYAVKSISVYNNKKTSGSSSETIHGIEATSYNLVDGKIEKSSMPSKLVFTEQTSDKYRTTKFTIPNVQVGTIVEYKYRVKSPYYAYIPTWYAQLQYPVKYAECNVLSPAYFIFNHFAKGYCELDSKLVDTNVTWGNGKVNGFKVYCKGHDLTAIDDEPFVENPRIYAGRMEFELLGIQIPGQKYESYAHTWDDVRKYLEKHEHFGKYLSLKTPFAEKLDSIDFSTMSTIEKARTVFKVLKSNVKWDETYSLYPSSNPRTALEKGKGSNAQLNFLLLSMLKHVGISCTPTLVKPRSDGMIVIPTVDDFETFVIAFVGDNNDVYFLDSASDYGDVNSLSVELLGYGVLYDPSILENPLGVYELFNIGGNVSSVDIQALVSEDGEMQAQIKNTRHGMLSLLHLEDYHEKDSLEYMKELEDDDDLKLLSYSLRDLDKIGSQCRETIRFTKSVGTSDNRMYINPIVLPDEETNHFTSETRVCPIEFSFPQVTKITSRLTIPDNYEVEEMPKDKSITMLGNGIEASISFKVLGNVIMTKYQATLNTTLVLPNDYDRFRTFWNDLLEMNDLTIVLKKK